jgi:peptide/nickel transport system substrate-binding protein
MWDSVPPSSIGYPPDLIGDASSCPQLNIEGLLRENNKGEMSPWLAESYKVADDLKSITFTLRKGVKFHDGSDLNAQVAKWNLDNRIAAKLEPFWTSIDIVDDYTVRVNLNQWRNTIIRNFGDGPGGWMISKAAFDKNGLDWVRQNPVGTGPFKFVSFARDTSYKTVKNPNYWQTGKPYLDGVDVVFVSDPLTQQAVMKSGAADMMILEPGKQAYDMQQAGLTIIADIVTNFFDSTPSMPILHCQPKSKRQ